MGRKDSTRVLQDMICVSSFGFQQRGLHYCETGTIVFVDTGYASSAGQGGRRISPLLDRELSCYSQYFLVTRNDGGLRPG
jgi:hypothetical protein